MKKLSKIQQHIVDLMKSGWELGCSTSFNDNRCWIQKGGLSSGGDTEDVRCNTVYALEKRGLVGSKYEFPTRKYWLKESQ